MFDKLEDLLRRFEEILNELSEPDVTSNQQRFQALMKEQSDLTPIVEAYKEYKKCNQDIEDSIAMLEEEKDPEMREMLKEENDFWKNDDKISVDNLDNVFNTNFMQSSFDIARKESNMSFVNNDHLTLLFD